MHRGKIIVASVVVLAALAAVACSDDGNQTATGDTDSTAGENTTTSITQSSRFTVVGNETDGSIPEGSDEWVYPGDEWATGDPADHGLTPEGLDELATYLEASNSNCMAVVKDGVLVDERYWNDYTAETEQEIFSASKSVSSTLVGIAQDLEYLDITQPASDFITEWEGTDSETVTIQNLLSNDSGRYYDFETDYLRMATSPDRTAFAIDLDQQYPPGEHWEYNNSAIQTLQAVLSRSTDQSVNEFAAEHLFGPLGMQSEYSTDQAGNEPTFMGVQSSCGDMARFGYLFLRGGWWDGQQVVSSDYVTAATSPSQDLNRAYGYLWWLNEEGWLLPVLGGQGEGLFWPDTPDDAFAALGLGDQIVLVLPSQDMVITRAGPWRETDAPVANTSVNEIGRLAVAALAE